MKRLLLLLIIPTLFMVWGCTSTPKVVPKDQCRVAYIKPDGQGKVRFGGFMPCEIAEDAAKTGRVKYPNYHYWVQYPEKQK